MNADDAIGQADLWPAGEGGPRSWIRDELPDLIEYAQAEGFELVDSSIDKCELVLDGEHVFGQPVDWGIVVTWLWGYWTANRAEARLHDIEGLPARLHDR